MGGLDPAEHHLLDQHRLGELLLPGHERPGLAGRRRRRPGHGPWPTAGGWRGRTRRAGRSCGPARGRRSRPALDAGLPGLPVVGHGEHLDRAHDRQGDVDGAPRERDGHGWPGDLEAELVAAGPGGAGPDVAAGVHARGGQRPQDEHDRVDGHEVDHRGLAGRGPRLVLDPDVGDGGAGERLPVAGLPGGVGGAVGRPGAGQPDRADDAGVHEVHLVVGHVAPVATGRFEHAAPEHAVEHLVLPGGPQRRLVGGAERRPVAGLGDHHGDVAVAEHRRDRQVLRHEGVAAAPCRVGGVGAAPGR